MQHSHETSDSMLTALPQWLGNSVITMVKELGAMGIFMCVGLKSIFTRKQLPKIVRQIRIIGAESMFLVALIGIFTGMVLGLQGFHVLSSFASEGALGAMVALSLVRELGPVLTAIMVVGRAGSAMTAEIGVMRISEQLDALEVMDINPYSFLVGPRLAASIIVFPLLTAIFNVIGIFGGYVAGVTILGMNSGLYWFRVEDSVQFDDVFGCLVKSVVFALIVATVSCYKGFFTHMRTDSVGPEAVSNATTSAVVLSCVLILISDYIITSMLI